MLTLIPYDNVVYCPKIYIETMFFTWHLMDYFAYYCCQQSQNVFNLLFETSGGLPAMMICQGDDSIGGSAGRHASGGLE